MKTFSEKESQLVAKLKDAPAQTVLELRESCPSHSYCNPLPLFRLYRVDESTFEAQWNSHHRKGPTQSFEFSDITLGSLGA